MWWASNTARRFRSECTNAWIYGINLARQATTLDVVGTDPYHYNHAKEFFHRPHRRILTEGTRSLMGAAYDRQVDIYTQGFMPLTQAVPMGRQDGLLEAVVPFALGADMVVPYTYELMKIIPGFFEGFQEARKLIDVFESHRPYAYATTVMRAPVGGDRPLRQPLGDPSTC